MSVGRVSYEESEEQKGDGDKSKYSVDAVYTAVYTAYSCLFFKPVTFPVVIISRLEYRGVSWRFWRM